MSMMLIRSSAVTRSLSVNSIIRRRGTDYDDADGDIVKQPFSARFALEKLFRLKNDAFC